MVGASCFLFKNSHNKTAERSIERFGRRGRSSARPAPSIEGTKKRALFAPREPAVYAMKKFFLNVDPNAVDPETAFFHVLPIPFGADGPRTKLAANAPDAILDASAALSRIDERSKRSRLRLGVYTHDPICADDPTTLARRFELIEEEFELFSPRRFPIVLGGSVEISEGPIRCARKRFDELTAIRMSARADLRAAAGADVMTLGVRSFDEQDIEAFPDSVEQNIGPDRIEDEFENVLETILWRAERNVYLSIDMSVFDPSVAPGTCFPEPGGLRWRRALELIEAIVAGKCVVGCDLVGVAPLGGNNIVTEYAAAKLIATIIDLVGGKRT